MKSLRNLIFAINILAIVALAASYVASFIPPSSMPIAETLALAYPVGLIINLLFIFWWVIVDVKRSIYSIAIVLLGIGFFMRFVQFKGEAYHGKTEDRIHLMSYNVQLFGLYNWKDNKKIRDSIINQISKEKLDIFCCQEYCKVGKGKFRTGSIIMKELGMKYRNESFFSQDKYAQNFGMATFMKYPIVAKGDIRFEGSNNMAQYTDFIFKSDTIRCYNVHLQSIHFDRNNYNDVDNLSIKELDKNQLDKVESLLGMINKAASKRAPQAQKIKEHINSSPYPVIVCGDFNDTPSTYTYRKVAKGLDDAFKTSGSGFDISFQRSYFRMRIDHILTSPNIKAYSFHAQKLQLSDHYPVSCYLTIDSE